MTREEWVAAIRRDGEAFWDAVASNDLDARVPSCPEWSVRDLAGHLARVHTFWTKVVEEGLTEIEVPDEGSDQPADDELVPWGRARLGHLLDVFTAADLQAPAWTWAAQKDAAFIVRHQVQEAAVHRWDAELAAGTPSPIEAATASDSIDEFLTRSRPAVAGAPLPGTIHLHCTDVDGEWFVHPDGRVEPIHAKGDAALRGPASDLLLVLYHRVPLDQLDVIGDRAVADAFLAPEFV